MNGVKCDDDNDDEGSIDWKKACRVEDGRHFVVEKPRGFEAYRIGRRGRSQKAVEGEGEGEGGKGRGRGRGRG